MIISYPGNVPPSHPVYPPYHTGLYLEDYFTHKYKTEQNKLQHINFIDVTWTNLYVSSSSRHVQPDLQDFLNALPQDQKYFVVCQHDDAPFQQLPPNTYVFSAGGNMDHINLHKIPLICSPIPKLTPQPQKDIFCSFVGAISHPLRFRIFKQWKEHYNFSISDGGWSPSITNDRLAHFIETTSRSRFTLCPRGYGKTSYRLYEAMQLGSVPVYVSDDHFLPWEDEIDWTEMCVLVKDDQIANIDHILRSIDEEQYTSMIHNIAKVYSQYFTLDATYNNILRILRSHDTP